MRTPRLITAPVETEAEVEVYIDDFSDEDLIDEVRARGMIIVDSCDELREDIETAYRMILAKDDPQAIVRAAHDIFRELLGVVL